MLARITHPTIEARVALSAQRVDPKVFDYFLTSFDGVFQESTAAFSAARWPSMTLEPWVYRRGVDIVAAAMVMVKRLPMGVASLAVSKWGPILAHETAPDREDVYEAALDHLIAEYGDRRGMMLSILERPQHEDLLHSFAALQDRGFRPGHPLPFPNYYFLPVRMSDAELRKNFAQKWRYHLTKAEQAGLKFEVGADASRFQKLYQAMLDRKKFPDYSAYHTLEHIMAALPPQLRPRLFFVSKDGEDLAGAAIFTAGRTAAYLYGATNDRALSLRAGYFMHFHITRWLREHTRAEWYDLGGTDGFHGLHQFKKGMIGAAGKIAPLPPIMNYAASASTRLVGDLAFAARDALMRVRHVAMSLKGNLARPDQGASP